MRFSSVEIQHLLRAWFIISLAFAILLSGADPSLSMKFLRELIEPFVISSITVGLGFLLHELAHKFLAQRYGANAEFRAFDVMLMAALVMSFFGAIFAAPGAVFIYGNINVATNGRISAIGPAVNVALAFLFLFLLLGVSAFGGSLLLTKVALYGIQINGLLAVFNMLPLLQMDGLKVWRWNRQVYAALMGASVFAMLLPWLLPG